MKKFGITTACGVTLLSTLSFVAVASALCLLSGCGSWNKNFMAKLNAAMNDGVVTEQEYGILKAELLKHPEGVNIGGSSMRTEDDLVTFFRDKGVCGTAAALNVVEVPFSRLYVMLDNSASMEGYSKSSRNREFTTPVIALWNALEEDTEVVAGYAHHNAKSECEFETVPSSVFQSNLTNGRTKVATSSPIDQIINRAVDLTDDSSVAAIITDGIMSGTNAEIQSSLPDRMWTYNNMPVLEQRVRIAMEKAAQKGLAFSVYRFEASFKGVYYNFKNLRQNMNEVERPFFIILIGSERYVRTMDERLMSDGKFDYEDHLSSYEIADLPLIKNGVFSIIPAPGLNLGDFNQSPAKMEITFKKDLTFPVSLSLKVTIPATVSDEIADDDFLEDYVRIVSVDPITKYEVDFTGMVQKVEDDRNVPGLFNFILEAAPDFVNVISGVRVLRITVPVSYETIYPWYIEDSIESDAESGWDTEKTFALANIMDSFFRGYGIRPRNIVDISVQLKK